MEKWTPEEAKQLELQARRLLTQHDCRGPHRWAKDRELAQTNCGACMLHSYKGKAYLNDRKLGLTVQDGRPNYAGWLRVYIQGSVPIHFSWYSLELDEARRENKAYYDAILKDEATFRIMWKSGKVNT